MSDVAVAARTVVYATLAFAPLAILLLPLSGRAGGRTGRGRVMAVLAVLAAPGVIAGCAAALGGAGLAASLWVAALVCSYQIAWASGALLLGAGRLAAVVVAVLPPLFVAATFAPNALVESAPGELSSPLAPVLLAHLDPVIGIGHHLLHDAVLVRNYSYYQAEASPPSPARLLTLYLAFALVALAITSAARLSRRSRRASPVDRPRRSPASP